MPPFAPDVKKFTLEPANSWLLLRIQNCEPTKVFIM